LQWFEIGLFLTLLLKINVPQPITEKFVAGDGGLPGKKVKYKQYFTNLYLFKRGPGTEPLIRGSGGKPPEAKSNFCLSEVQIRNKFAHFC